MPAVPEVEFGPEEQKDLFEVFYRKHKPADVEDSVAMAAKLTADKGFGKIRKALTKKYGDDPLPLWRAAKKAREAAGGKGGGAQGEPEPEAEEDEEEEEEKLPRVIPEGHHQLSATWVAWAQRAPEPGQKRGEAFPIGDFATVEEFWTSWRWVPSPSKAFNQMHRPARERVPVVSLAVFKDGIEPKRKHKANERGGMWASIQIARRGEPPSDVLENGVRLLLPRNPDGRQGTPDSRAARSQLVDDLWNNLIYGCIGETIDAVRVAAPPGRRSSH